MPSFAEEEDTRPRNPEHRKEILRMMNPDRLRREMNLSDDNSEHSIDEVLEDSDQFLEWVQRKGRNRIQKMQKKLQSPVNAMDSDYNIEFTRINRTTDSLTPSSLSSLNIPITSNASLTLNNSTPAGIGRASGVTRRSSVVTPARIIREKQQHKIEQLTSEKKKLLQKDFNFERFLPHTASTPVRSARKRNSIFPQHNDHNNIEVESVVSLSDEENDEQTSTPTKDRRKKILGGARILAELSSSMSVPETQGNSFVQQNKDKNDSIIPETQQNESVIPETQENESIIPETQENDSASLNVHDECIPDTQENQYPATQDAVTKNPVQAQVKPNTEQQAESRITVLNYSTRRIQSRPSIHGDSLISTPKTKVPLMKPTLRTPSRLPVPITRTPKTIALTPLTPIRQNNHLRPEVSSSNAQNVEVIQSPVSQIPSSQSNHPNPVPQAVNPTPTNVTVNVNVTNSIPQSEKQKSQTNATTTDIDNRRNSSGNSIMTDDNDSGEQKRCETPKPDSRNTSARRTLFKNHNDNEAQYRRSVTYNKFDNLTHTIDGHDSMPSQIHQRSNRSFRPRATNSISTNPKSPSLIAPAHSHTFVKQKVSNQDATYDIQTENSSRRSSVANINLSDTDEIHTSEESSRFNNDMELPSEALLDSMQLTEDERSENISNDTNKGNNNDKSSSKDSNKTNNTKKPAQNKSHHEKIPINLNPVVVLDQLQTNMPRTSIANQTSGLNLRESNAYGPISPPRDFQDADDLIKERSPTSQREIEKPIRNAPPPKALPKKRLQKKQNEDLNVVTKNLEEMSKKPTSKKSGARRLRSTYDIHENDDDDGESIELTNSDIVRADTEVAEVSTDIPSSSKNNSFTFKKPTKPAPRRTRHNSMNVSESDASKSQSDILVTVDVVPLNDDESIASDQNPNDLTNQSNENKRLPKPKQTRQPKKPSTKKNKSNPKTKEADTTNITENNQSVNNTTAGSIGVRRTSRDLKKTVNDRLLYFTNSWRTIVQKQPPTPQPKPRTKRKAKEMPEPQQDVPDVLDSLEVNEPPRKKQRSESRLEESKLSNRRAPSSKSSETASKRSRKAPTVSSMKSSRSSKSVKSSKTSSTDRTWNPQDRLKFHQYLKSQINKVNELQWWNELRDMTQKDPIVHNVDEVDVEHINNLDGTIEVSSTDKIEYMDVNGVDYGYVPSSIQRRCGFMRFMPNSSKDKAESFAEFILHVLCGQFTMQCDDRDMEIKAGVDIIVPKGASYGLTNRGNEVGIIQFIDVTDPE